MNFDDHSVINLKENKEYLQEQSAVDNNKLSTVQFKSRSWVTLLVKYLLSAPCSSSFSAAVSAASETWMPSVSPSSSTSSGIIGSGIATADEEEEKGRGEEEDSGADKGENG